MTEGEGRLVVGRYRLHRVLGRGGMGTVWHATDEHLNRDVAIKEIQLHGRQLLPADPEVRRALREGRAAAKVGDHPGIITVHDVVSDDHGLPWIVMQLLKGRSLSAELATDGPLPVHRTAWIGAQVLAALDYAHHGNVLHRDVKPGNVMLTDSRVVLTDFGIATIEGASVITETGQLAGAPEYIAPERIEGKEAQPATDLWSVGVMLYAMVVGQTPFRRDSIRATTTAALTQDPNPDEKIGPLWPVIQGLLRKRPAERMTAGRAIDLLNRIPADCPVPPGSGGAGFPDPTMPEHPDTAKTVTEITVRTTRVSPPPFWPGPRPAGRPRDDSAGPSPRLAPEPPKTPANPVSNPPWVPPDAPTIDPPGPPRPRHGALIACAAILVIAAIVTLVIVISMPDDRQGVLPRSTAPPATAGRPSLPELAPHQDPLGFEIEIPPDWPRRPSGNDQLGDVTWWGPSLDSTVGALVVQVRRDTTTPGVSVTDYLAGRIGDKTDYYRIDGRNDGGSAAFLEYTYRDGSRYYHVWERVLRASEVLYTLTFTLDANDDKTLTDRWTAVEPTVDGIRQSFRLDS